MNVNQSTKPKRGQTNYVAWKFGGVITKLEWPKRAAAEDIAADEQFHKDLLAATRRYLEATSPKRRA